MTKLVRTAALSVGLLGCALVCLPQAHCEEADSIDKILRSAFVRSTPWIESETVSDVINIYNNTSMVLRFDRDITRVAVSNPDICDLTPVGTSDILIVAKKVGKANLIVWDQEGSIATYGIQSTLDVERLEKVLRRIDPDTDVKIVSINNTVAVYGTAGTSLKLKQMSEAIKTFEGGPLNFLQIRKPKQILLEVRFAEVDRTALKAFKFDINVISRWGPFGSTIGQTGALATSNLDGGDFVPRGNVWDFGNGLGPVPKQSTSDLFWGYYNSFFAIQPYLKFLESRNLLKLIARPNLVAKDGEESEFKVGGEYPVPVNSDVGVVTVAYKEYGTEMKFTPEILDDEVIRLKIRAQVSEIDTSTTVTSGSVSVPGIIKRVQSSVLELKENQTLVIGGLMSQKITKVQRKLPGLSDVPLFGRLFTGEQLDRIDVELLIVITPHIVKPMDLGEPKEFYNESLVKRSIRTYEPFFPDTQGDSIHDMLSQNEPKDEFRIAQKKQDAQQFAANLSDRFSGSSSATPAADSGDERSWGWKKSAVVTSVLTRPRTDLPKKP